MANAVACLDDYQRLAKTFLSESVYNYISNGSGREVTLKDNILSLDSWRIRPRVLVDVSERDLSTTILGHDISFPVCVGPTAMHGFVHKEAENATVKGAHAAGVGFTLSIHSSKSIEDVVESSPDSLRFFQLYILQDKHLTQQHIHRAEKQGYYWTHIVPAVSSHYSYKAFVLTADSPIIVNNKLNVDALPPDFLMRNFLPWPVPENGKIDESVAHPRNIKTNYSLNFTWDDLKWLMSITHLPVILKGILTGEDAKLAVDCGVSGIVVSNHGGRNLDSLVSSIDALPEVVRAVNGRCEVYMDGGVRNGTDIFKALALGARAVFIGRPAVFALACNGTEGVRQMLEILKEEFSETLALAGCKSVKDIRRDMVVHTNSYTSKL